MSEFKIRRGVPIPPVVRAHRRCEFPWLQMQPGDSIDVAEPKWQKVRHSFGSWRTRHPGWQFTSRRLPDGSLRVWVTARPDVAATQEDPAVEQAEAPGTSVAARLRQAAAATKSGTRTVRGM